MSDCKCQRNAGSFIEINGTKHDLCRPVQRLIDDLNAEIRLLTNVNTDRLGRAIAREQLNQQISMDIGLGL